MAIPENRKYTNGWHLCSCLNWHVGLILILCLTLSTFKKDVEYYEIGILKNSISNKIDKSHIYTSGYYTKGSHTMQTYEAIYQQVSFTGDESLSVFNEDGVEFNVGVNVFWKLIPDDFIKLFTTFGTSYKAHVKAEILSSLKNVANDKGIDVYLEDRVLIANLFHNEIRKELIDGIFSPLGKLHLEEIVFPERITHEYLIIAVTFQENLEREFDGQVQTVQLETAAEVAEINANRTLLETNYSVNAEKIVSDSVAEADQLKGSADIEGQNLMFDYFNFTDISVDTQTKIIELILQRNGGNNPRYIVVDPESTVIINPPSLLEVVDEYSFINKTSNELESIMVNSNDHPVIRAEPGETIFIAAKDETIVVQQDEHNKYTAADPGSIIRIEL